jgi:hypothetical protein
LGSLLHFFENILKDFGSSCVLVSGTDRKYAVSIISAVKQRGKWNGVNIFLYQLRGEKWVAETPREWAELVFMILEMIVAGFEKKYEKVKLRSQNTRARNGPRFQCAGFSP